MVSSDRTTGLNILLAEPDPADKFIISYSLDKKDIKRGYQNYAAGYIYKNVCKPEKLKPSIKKALAYWSSVCLPSMGEADVEGQTLRVEPSFVETSPS